MTLKYRAGEIKMESKNEKEYRDEVFKNKEMYPNLFDLESKKNRWNFKQSFKKR